MVSAPGSITPEEVRGAVQRDRAALEQLVKETAPVVQARVAAALWRLGRSSRHELEDLTQEVFIELLSKEGAALCSWSPDKGLSFQGFVGLIAQRVVLNVLRSKRRNPFEQHLVEPTRLQDLSDQKFSHESSGSAEARQLLRLIAERLHEKLSPQGLEVFYRLFVWQESVESISQALGLSAEAVYQWRTRLRKAALEVQAELQTETSSVFGPIGSPAGNDDERP